MRARLFDELGLRDADGRPGVGVRNGGPDLVWRKVPAGRFWMGGDPLALGALPGRPVDLDANIYMTAYPMTIAQFEASSRRVVTRSAGARRWRSGAARRDSCGPRHPPLE